MRPTVALDEQSVRLLVVHLQEGDEVELRFGALTTHTVRAVKWCAGEQRQMIQLEHGTWHEAELFQKKSGSIIS